ncbi:MULTISPECIES: thermonuclease family protein [Bacillus]|uniref:thermonuclease family protein n=1 Tax=Bacillus TaxID=1386 RepID=UPI000E59DA6A|nr:MULTISPECIES: thermonuclease family protein [Bacillus]MCM3250436.1 thermonuclease family protein [Bacillus amyloliquefaciens]MCY7426869.1 thermonuclease family protein [Bacillus amyloliquefaciens]MCY8932550.1 thermonuclease family protein [Bacillus atrophaeus]MCY8942339.1 thermonuclease family protein [Bacillus atrophaeus]MEC0965460.1 thermonuclease family protein [Bacillus amyloliquefaciens]
MKKWLLGIGALTLSFSLAACGSTTSSEKNTESSQQTAEKQSNETSKSNSTKSTENKKNLVDVTLEKSVDGDTIKVKYNGKSETVRYLLIDTPETKKPNSCVQPYGEDASKRNKELVSYGKLQLEFDKGDQRDKYGRMLAYVYVDGKSVQETLLKEGLARVAYVYEPNTKYIDQFEKDEQQAKTEKLSIWSKSGYVTDKGFNGCVKDKTTDVKKSTTSKQSISQSSASKNSNADSKETSDDTNDTQTSSAVSSSGSESFANCTELRKKYPNGVPSSHPAYQSKMDRDHDNYACER